MPSSSQGQQRASPGFTCVVVSGSMKMPTEPSGVSRIRSSDTRPPRACAGRSSQARHPYCSNNVIGHGMSAAAVSGSSFPARMRSSSGAGSLRRSGAARCRCGPSWPRRRRLGAAGLRSRRVAVDLVQQSLGEPRGRESALKKSIGSSQPAWSSIRTFNSTAISESIPAQRAGADRCLPASCRASRRPAP